MSTAYHRLVRMIDHRDLSRMLEHALDRHVIVKLCKACGLTYDGRSTKHIPLETLAADLARDCFHKEGTGRQVLDTLAEASADEIDRIRRSEPEHVLAVVDGKTTYSARECCRMTVAILLDDRKAVHVTGPALLHKAGRSDRHNGKAAHRAAPVEEADFKKQIHDLNQALITARTECSRLEKQNRILEARLAQLHDGSSQPAKLNSEGAAPGDHKSRSSLADVEKSVADIKQSVQDATQAMQDDYRDLKKTIAALQQEVGGLRRAGENRRSDEVRHPKQQDHDRIGIFVDVQNMFYAAKQYGARLDFEKLMCAAVGERRLVRAYAYVIQTPEVDQTGFVTMLQQRSYQVKRKDLRQRSDGSAKGDWDMGMAIDMIGMADKLDTVVLVSGDGDFVSLVHLLKEMGPRVEVFSFPHNTARDLMETADHYHPIDENMLIKMEQRTGSQESSSSAIPKTTDQ